MSKNGTESKLSYKQYKLADVMLFLLIMCVCEIINVLAIRSWFPGMLFTISVMMLVTLISAVRWNWVAFLYPVADGALYCWLGGGSAVQFAVYIIGNACVALVWLLFLVVPKEKVMGKWYFTVLYALLGFVLLLMGRSLTALCFGNGFVDTLLGTLPEESLNLLFAIVGLLILRRIDGMLVDQKKYLFKVTREQEELKRGDDYRWDGYTELDEEELRRLASMDEYDKALNFNNRSLKNLKEADGHELEEGDVTPEAPAAKDAVKTEEELVDALVAAVQLKDGEDIKEPSEESGSEEPLPEEENELLDEDIEL